MNKRFAILLILILTASSPIVVKPAYSSITKPSVPEFTLEYVDHSYYVPPTYGIDQFTGKSIITEEGYHVDNRTIEFTIKNQPFTSYVDASGNNINLYYKFRYKGPYGNDWSYYPDSSHTYVYWGYSGYDPFPDTSASNSDYTVIAVNLRALTSYPPGTPEIPIGGQVEFQVQAIIGYVEHSSTGMLAGSFVGFVGERSDWSETVTFTYDLTPPHILILSPQQQDYFTSNVKLTFSVNEQLNQTVYSLDGKENTSILGNTTLTGLSDGSHNITVYAWDIVGNVGASETVFFDVKATFLTEIVVIAAVVSIVLVGIGLLVYFKKRRG